MRLLKVVANRVGSALITLFTLATVTFALMRAVPGDPLLQTKEIPAETKANLMARYGLDKPIWEQYLIQMKHIFLEGDFGSSFRTLGREVNDIIKEQFPVSAAVGVFAITFGVMIGIGLGILAALYRNTAVDRFAMFLCVVGISLPSFLIAYILQYFIAVYPLTNLGFNPELWFRPAGWGEPKDIILPGVTLSFAIMAAVTRIMRSQMVDVAFSEFVKTAKSKGVSTFRLVFTHQIRNAILPVISVVGPLLGIAVVGSLIIEGIFGIPGLGRAYINSIENSDYNVIMGLTIFYGGFIILINLVTDVIYTIIDPRIRIS